MTETEHHIQVTRSARYWQLGTVQRDTRELWLCCHGYGQLAGRFIKHFLPISATDRVVVAPEGLHRFYLDPPDRPATERRVGASWMTREDRETDIADYCNFLDAVCSRVLSPASGKVKLVAFGFSQGTATVSRWAAWSDREIDRLVLWGSGLPPDLDWSKAGARFAKMRVYMVGGERDAQMPADAWAEQQKLLSRHHVAVRLHRFAGGHHMDAETLRQLAAE